MNIILVVVVALLVAERNVEADFLYNRVQPKKEDLKALGLKCIPGRTTITVEERLPILQSESEEDDDMDTRRTHMNAERKEGNCKVCVCSVEGKDEYCSRRPARNVNECIRMSLLKEQWEKHVPFSHERSLAFRIRRDYIWHDDEIPYEPMAACRRGRSYYSNSVTANDTDIDVASDIDSLLDYSNKDICFFCTCSLDGKSAGCISRDPYFCEYYRIIRNPNAARDRYRALFNKDKPAYFRLLSYRLRRKMDEGVFDLMENGGDTLCCQHPDGHRRNLHDQVRNKIRLMRRKVPKENIMSGSPGVGSGLEDLNCVPFISAYSDCSAANACSGCTKCSCNAKGKWDCQRVVECPQKDENEAVDELMLENALDNLYSGLYEKKSKKILGSLVPSSEKPPEDLLLVPEVKFDMDAELRSVLFRKKRSTNGSDSGTVKFYETVDETNEDTLKNSGNNSGTIEAPKINAQDISKLSRRAGVFDHNNASDISSLHIDYNQPLEFEHHVLENKVDSKHPLEDKINGLSHEVIHKILGNYSQSVKNNDLSKMIVNELSRGTEIIGDKNVKPLSNITFTPENDTLTAMAFIAGNLLNKLWDMEKDAGEGSFETEGMKHKKVNDLLDLFKEPLSLRQENFLKNALEKLSRVIDTNKNLKDVTLCENFEDVSTAEEKNCTDVSNQSPKPQEKNLSHKSHSGDGKKLASRNALGKINDVLNLIKKYEQIQNSLSNLKHDNAKHEEPILARKEYLSPDEKNSLNLFGNLLSKITNLLTPNRNGNKITGKVQQYNLLRQDDTVKKNIEKIFDIDLSNTTLSVKDKMIVDYLSSLERHPNCFFANLKKPIVTPITNVEGSILYNLSEFFKIQSFADLLKQVEDKPDTNKIPSTTARSTTYNPTTTKQSTQDINLRTSIDGKPAKIESAKEKLKNDLKTILQDLVDLQSQHGLKPKSGINIADVLPCLYNTLKADSNTNENSKNNYVQAPSDKIKSFIEALKSDVKFSTPNRRRNVMTQRPKSAVVWERAIKNLDKQHRPTARRSLGQDKKSYDELKDMMDKVDLSGNTYKNFALQSGVEPSQRLMLLKTLQADVKQYTTVLENIKRFLETNSLNLPLDKQNEFAEFVENAATNINVNRKVTDVIGKPKTKQNVAESINPKSSPGVETKQSLVMPKIEFSNENHNFNLRRDQIINQIILNRIKLYIKTKEMSNVDVNADINYNLAKRIMFYLENGNTAVAKELFKVFVANKQQNSYQEQFTGFQNSDEGKRVESIGPKLLAFREPLVRLEDPKKIKMLSRDYFQKQLWNLRDLKE